MPTLNDLHLAMGEFLTESSQVENMMLALVTVCRGDRPMDKVFVEFMGKTFGQKIDTFKARCRTRNFTDAHRKILDDVEGELDRLLPKRNLIVHGTTYQMGKDGTPPQPYRIGMTKAGEFMNERSNKILMRLTSLRLTASKRPPRSLWLREQTSASL